MAAFFFVPRPLLSKSPSSAAEDVPSPCVQVCELDADGICTGCLRSIGEIAAWGGAPAARRREILQAVARRRMRQDHPPGRRGEHGADPPTDHGART
ncbi:MAG: DUF1289 domain-containing protein [Sinimarinibacterium flocculans]|uniref:DUF1289 domain-containing protein n=1 Tax=Sinimarinibacterium flocculans TaxID=985250 RepID=UPI003C5F186D